MMKIYRILMTLFFAAASPVWALDLLPKLPYCPPKTIDASTLTGKFMFGYQGWFGYPGDGSANNAWFHWHNDYDGKVHLNVDMFPDVSEYGAEELSPSALTLRDGSPHKVYSAYNSKTVERHFEWMRDYGLDGVFLQRFSGEFSRAPLLLAFRDHVTKNVQASAEKNGRVFSIMYDISGDKLAVENLEKDWTHLVDDLKITRSNRYIHHKGKPVLAVWGLGFEGNIDAKQAAELIRFFKENPRPELRVTLMAGVPTHWRTLSQDSLPDPAWAAVYRSADIISPWAVGRFADLRGADRFRRENLEPDLAEAKKLGLEYMPVLFPGYSAHNLSRGEKPLNEIRRQGGHFFWRQVFNAMDAGATMFYGAMFDEVDEGTAFLKVVPDSGLLPTQGTFVSLDSDGYVLPSDWYLKLAGLAGMAMRGIFQVGSQLPVDPGQPGKIDGCLYCPGAGVKNGQGDVISVNFMGGGSLGIPGPMAPVERAGIKPAAYWNNLEFDAGSQDGLLNDAGQKTESQIAWKAGGVWSTPIIETMGDARMMKGYLDTQEGTSITVQVKGLPALFASKGYKVVVYMDGDDKEATRKAWCSLGSQSVEFTDAADDFFAGKFIRSKDGKPGN